MASSYVTIYCKYSFNIILVLIFKQSQSEGVEQSCVHNRENVNQSKELEKPLVPVKSRMAVVVPELS